MLDDAVNKHFLMIQKVKTNNLWNYVLQNSGGLTSITHLVIDLSGLNDNDDEIIESINKLGRLYSDEMRIIVLADSVALKTERWDLLRRIFEKGVYNIVSEASPMELEKCLTVGKTRYEVMEFFVERPDLSTDDKQRELAGRLKDERQRALLEEQRRQDEERAEQAIKREQFLPNKDFRKYKPCVSVAVCGAEPHIGATHNALLITKFLKDTGFSACYLEANENQKIFSIKSLYPQSSSFNERRYLLQCFGVDIYSGFNISEVMAHNYDFYVFDLGVLTQDKMMSFLTKDIQILVGGARPWEITILQEAAKKIGAKKQTYFFLNHLIFGEEERLCSLMPDLRRQIFFPEHVPSPFTSGVNRSIYKIVFKEYLLQQVNEPPKPKQKKGFLKKYLGVI